MSDVFLVWDAKKLTTQVPEMDKEHIQLIDLMNKLHSLHTEGKAFEDQKRALGELANFTVSHFQHEEAFFSKIPYAQAEMHKKIHVDLLSRFKEFEKKFLTERKFSNDFFMFLKVWLSAHIMGVDAKYGDVAVKNRKAS